jgi:L,D-peptidoglycan transpeptidase YkuD (ErfK/YbiS/YcfS/YnhG family)
MMNKTKCSICILSVVLFFLLSAGRVPLASASGEEPAGWMLSSLEILARGTTQVLLVTNEESSGFNARLYALEKRGDAWRTAFPPLRVLIGEKGFARPGAKKEGDLKTPSGVFALKRTFGYGAGIPSRMPYRQAGKDDLWVDDASSPDYNRWVRRGETSAASFEVMRLNDDRYKYGIIIEYNTDPVVRGAGSAIFIHVRRAENTPTLGCVAMSESDILKILGWLDPAAGPSIVMGTRDSILSQARASREQPHSPTVE